jgi:hypothetical protein
MRWVALGCAILLFSLAFFKSATWEAIIAFSVGAFCGFVLDLFGTGKYKLWYYPRQPFLEKQYFAIVVPAWGVFGLTINLLWNWLNSPWLAFVVLTTGLLVFYELPNLKSGSWKYQSPPWLVAAGWFPLILYFRIVFQMIIA